MKLSEEEVEEVEEVEEDEKLAIWKFETSKLFNAWTDWLKISYSHRGMAILHRGENKLEKNYETSLYGSSKFFPHPFSPGQTY